MAGATVSNVYLPPVEPRPLRPMLVSGEVAVALNFLRTKDGQPDRRKVRKLAREGRIPGPVDDTLHALDWRWSRREIEQYQNGEWQTPAPNHKKKAS